MKIYLDTNILSNIIGLSRITNETGIALQKLATSNHNFITSQLLEKELQNARDPRVKGAILFIYKVFGGDKFLNKETYFATGIGDAPFGSVPFGGGEVESPVLSILRQAFEPDDARHIFQVFTSHSNFFLTLDENTILKRYRSNYQNIKVFCKNMKIVNPIELVEELNLK